MWQSMSKTQREIAQFSAADARTYPKYEDFMAKMGEPRCLPLPTSPGGWLLPCMHSKDHRVALQLHYTCVLQ